MINENKPAIEEAAIALWNSNPHQMLKAGGLPTDWAEQPNIVKNDYRRQAKSCVAAFLRASKEQVIPVPLPDDIDPDLEECGPRYAAGHNDAICTIKKAMIEIGMKY